MITAAQRLREMIDGAKPRLLAIAEVRASEKPNLEMWSRKEILGHLLDSAANNHQRIVRMQQKEDIGTFTYQQDQWVRIQHYQEEAWNELVEFWWGYNAHLVHVVARVDPGVLHHVCDMGYGHPASLAFVIDDYLRHVEHHLAQILEDGPPHARRAWVSRDPSDT